MDHLQLAKAEFKLPWHVQEPYEGCGGVRMQHSVVDDDGCLVCECDGANEGLHVAVFIVTLVNRQGPPLCFQCGREAQWFGTYDDKLSPVYACSDCIGDGEGTGEQTT